MFVITPQDPETYRRQTRRSTLIIAQVFIALAMLFSSAAVALFGQPGGGSGLLIIAAWTTQFLLCSNQIFDQFLRCAGEFVAPCHMDL